MLNNEYRYVAMDFETTGLDVKNDEAIQLWIEEIDVNWNIIKQFKSYIKPQKNVEELKSLVKEKEEGIIKEYISWKD